jgi:hypothetical protein
LNFVKCVKVEGKEGDDMSEVLMSGKVERGECE